MSYRKGPQLCLLACNPGDRFSSADVISSIEPPQEYRTHNFHEFCVLKK